MSVYYIIYGLPHYFIQITILGEGLAWNLNFVFYFFNLSYVNMLPTLYLTLKYSIVYSNLIKLLCSIIFGSISRHPLNKIFYWMVISLL